ncbi:MAG: hypothetical protein A3D65_03540 [Candidatus Lloydbacteria bacterium RIFCSPHIGHO2_02_FULL_50_13]|uniref:Uncharacterized protein n=1 Tax=Candidatus Lloydbacteria bacterium RIFCSPHIGHO2_02_FULL_50_13 TaxID=1798661 RepID=A0A1G2D621_9BACT|nr:MAG: hypothetical protein A3D65_03540 [Candidatus Lloydbacteria bacterium RIFCSPHIGHO2_02_FULL_50_13]
MRPHLWIAVILALAVGIGGLLWFRSERTSVPTVPESSPSVETPQSSVGDETSITNYDECITAGNPPLPDAPDKCLTKDGHVFIEGVIEEQFIEEE